MFLLIVVFLPTTITMAYNYNSKLSGLIIAALLSSAIIVISLAAMGYWEDNDKSSVAISTYNTGSACSVGSDCTHPSATCAQYVGGSVGVTKCVVPRGTECASDDECKHQHSDGAALKCVDNRGGTLLQRNCRNAVAASTNDEIGDYNFCGDYCTLDPGSNICMCTMNVDSSGNN